MKVCPHCKQTLPNLDLPAGLILRHGQLKLFRIVAAAGPNGIPTDDLLVKLYADDPDGGPLTARTSLRVRIYALNSKLIPYKLVIRAPRGGKHMPTEYTLNRL